MGGFREIALLVVGIILGSIAVLGVAPSVSASGSAVKAGVLNGEVETVAAGARLWMVNNGTTFAGINPETMGAVIPLVVSGTGSSSVYTSKVVNTVTYSVAAATSSSANDSFEITISNLDDVSGAEASMKSMLTSKYDTGVTDTTPGDGILVVKIRG